MKGKCEYFQDLIIAIGEKPVKNYSGFAFFEGIEKANKRESYLYSVTLPSLSVWYWNFSFEIFETNDKPAFVILLNWNLFNPVFSKTTSAKSLSSSILLGIGGVVTFKNGKIDQFLHELPLEAIVLETDAPYLAPNPYRGKRNESSYIPLILNKVAECYGQSEFEIATITTQNARTLFNF